MNERNITTKKITFTAIFIAVIMVLTTLVKIPFSPTQGYLTLADAGVYAAAFLLGPVFGGLAGGIATGLGDLLAGYPLFMVLTFFAHGLQAVVAGFVAKRNNSTQNAPRMIMGCIAGTAVMVGIYFVGEVAFLGIEAGAALLEIPGNIFQNVAGAFVSIPLVRGVQKAYFSMQDIN